MAYTQTTWIRKQAGGECVSVHDWQFGGIKVKGSSLHVPQRRAILTKNQYIIVKYIVVLWLYYFWWRFYCQTHMRLFDISRIRYTILPFSLCYGVCCFLMWHVCLSTRPLIYWSPRRQLLWILVESLDSIGKGRHWVENDVWWSSEGDYSLWHEWWRYLYIT